MSHWHHLKIWETLAKISMSKVSKSQNECSKVKPEAKTWYKTYLICKFA